MFSAFAAGVNFMALINCILYNQPTWAIVNLSLFLMNLYFVFKQTS